MIDIKDPPLYILERRFNKKYLTTKITNSTPNRNSQKGRCTNSVFLKNLMKIIVLGQLHSFNLTSLFSKIQVVTENKSCQERASKLLLTKNDLFHITLTG